MTGIPPVTFRGKAYDLTARTYVMGIINVTPDSFSQDGLYQKPNHLDLVQEQAGRMIESGADFLDIGAESTRPGAPKVDPAEEKARLLPALKELLNWVNIPISVDTYKPEVAAAALELGPVIINDIWGLKAPGDPEHKMAKVAASAGVPVIIMHNQTEPGYRDLINDVIASLAESITIASQAGLPRSQIIIDPGIGFGKTYHDNLNLLQNLDQLRVLGRPVLLGISRKSVIGLTLDLPVDQRLEGTIAANVWGISKGANIVRVHDVAEVARAVRMADAIKYFTVER